MGIEVGEDFSRGPRNLCPYCKNDLHLILDAFKPEITKIVESNCPHCGGHIFAAIMIILDVTQNALAGNIQAVLNLFNPDQTVTVDNPDAT